MSFELSYAYNAAGTLYAIIRDEATKKVWNGTKFVTWADGDIATYVLVLTDQGGDVRALDFPSLIPAGSYRRYYYVRAGGSPATTDTLLNPGGDLIAWDGEAESSLGSDFTTEAGLSKLAAINAMLGAIGKDPAVELDTGGSSDVALAESVLDRENQAIQAREWFCNTEENVPMVPDGTGRIPLANTVLSVRSDATSAGSSLARRGQYLYDLVNRTDQFTDTVYVRQVKLLDFVDLPPLLKEYITAYAAVAFQRQAAGSKKIDEFTLSTLQDKKVAALQEDDDNRQGNFYNNDDSRQIQGRRVGFISRR